MNIFVDNFNLQESMISTIIHNLRVLEVKEATPVICNTDSQFCFDVANSVFIICELNKLSNKTAFLSISIFNSAWSKMLQDNIPIIMSSIPIYILACIVVASKLDDPSDNSPDTELLLNTAQISLKQNYLWFTFASRCDILSIINELFICERDICVILKFNILHVVSICFIDYFSSYAYFDLNESVYDVFSNKVVKILSILEHFPHKIIADVAHCDKVLPSMRCAIAMLAGRREALTIMGATQKVNKWPDIVAEVTQYKFAQLEMLTKFAELELQNIELHYNQFNAAKYNIAKK